MAVELSWKDVSKVVDALNEAGVRVTQESLGAAFDVSASTISNLAKRGGWYDELKEATAHRIRSVDEALKAVADLVA